MPTNPISTDQLTISTDTPPNINNGWSQDGIIHDTPSRMENGHPSGIRFAMSFSYGPYAANTLYSGQPLFTDNVFALGWNLNNSYTPIDTTMGGPSIRIESRFQKATRNPANPGGYVDGSEYHVAQHTAGGPGVGQEYRSIGVWAPFHNEDWPYDSDISTQAAVYSFADGHRNPHVSFVWAGTATDVKSVNLSNQVRVNRTGNNQAWLSQSNAAGTSLINLPYVNSNNGYTFERDIYMSAGNIGTNALGIKSLLTLVGTSGFADGGRMVYLNTNPVTGSVTGFESEISASTRFEGVKVRNTHATGASGMRVHGNGACYIDLYNEANFHRWGLRLKPDGNFTIGQTVQGADIADALVINFTTLQTEFKKAPKLPNYAVAGLPTASTAGAGAMAFCTNESGGAVPVFSDGTSWRRVTDRAVVS